MAITTPGSPGNFNTVTITGTVTVQATALDIRPLTSTDVVTVVGNVASGATDSGNPVKVGGRFNSSIPTLLDGQRGDLQLGSRGALRVELFAGSSANAINVIADNLDGVTVSATGNKIAVVSRNTIFNGTSWDRTVSVINATNSIGTGITAAGILAQFDDVAPTAITENQFGNLRMSANRNMYTTIRDAAGSERGANVNSSGQLSVSVDNTPNVGTVTTVTSITNPLAAGTNLIGDVDVAPRTTGGWSVGNFTSGDTYTALTATAQVIKASAGKFGGYYIYNPNAAATYVLVYDIAAANVTVGTSTAKLVFCIPASSGANLEILAGIPFATAMSIAAATTGGGASAPSTALEAMVWFK